MNYEKALEQTKKDKPTQHYLVVHMQYGPKLVLQYDKGIVLLEALKEAEQFDGTYSANRINPLEPNLVSVSTLPKDQYDLYKIAGLMNVTFNEAKEARDAHLKPSTNSDSTT